MHGNRDIDTPTPPERTGTRWNPLEQGRKNARALGKHISMAGIVPTADFAGISKSTVAAWFNENRDALGACLAFAGLKVVSVDKQCYDRDEIDAIFKLAKKAMSAMKSADDLNFEDAE